ncbi:MAG TPA: MFS transporter [Anaerolineales bacterium]|nr:MFS transporter [Anaerolineales bacterium]
MTTAEQSQRPSLWQLLKRKEVFGWTMYDWGNSAFATIIMAAVLPVYYSKVAGSTLPGNTATVYWAYTTSIALLIVALISPVLGAMADFSGAKKRYLTGFALFGILGTALLYGVYSGDWLKASIFYIIGNVGFAGANVFYDGLLPHVAAENERDMVSAAGYALGYLGGGLLLAVSLGLIMTAPDEKMGFFTRLSFLMTAIWWLVFTIPLWVWVPEPVRRVLKREAGMNPVQAGFSRLAHTFRKVQRYDELWKFLLAFWLYNDGIGTIIKMATIYGAEIGIGSTDLIGTLLLVQFVGIPFSFFFGWLAGKIGTKRAIYITLAVYTLISIGGYFMSAAWHFWLLGLAVATVQGGSQALSRSLFSQMVPKSQSAEFFGFFSVSSKFAGIFGPLLFGLVGQLMGSSRLSIVSIILFFILGGYILTKVDVEAGMQVAKEEEALLAQEAVGA